jgi:hypothetical protein
MFLETRSGSMRRKVQENQKEETTASASAGHCSGAAYCYSHTDCPGAYFGRASIIFEKHRTFLLSLAIALIGGSYTYYVGRPSIAIVDAGLIKPLVPYEPIRFRYTLKNFGSTTAVNLSVEGIIGLFDRDARPTNPFAVSASVRGPKELLMKNPAPSDLRAGQTYSFETYSFEDASGVWSNSLSPDAIQKIAFSAQRLIVVTRLHYRDDLFIEHSTFECRVYTGRKLSNPLAFSGCTIEDMKYMK